MTSEFFLPDEITGTSFRELAQKMAAELPDDIDATEGGLTWDFIAPSALEASELLEFWLPLALKNAFYMFATGKYLDLHAEQCGLTRKPATPAYGDVTVWGLKGVGIPTDFVFSVPSENGVAAIDFRAVEPGIIGDEGYVTVRVEAVLSGTGSNVSADTITIMKTPIVGVTRISNETDMTGGTEAESDDSLRERIRDYYAGRGASFVGNKQDYERWAMQVAGVGRAYCVPVYNGPNTVKIVVTDANGEPANAEICAAVEEYIFGESKDDINRLAPVGIVEYLVAPPEPVDVNIALELKLKSGVSFETVESKLRENLRAFYQTIEIDQHADRLNYVRYVDISRVIAETYGVADFKHLRVNGTLENVAFKIDQYPRTADLVTV